MHPNLLSSDYIIVTLDKEKVPPPFVGILRSSDADQNILKVSSAASAHLTLVRICLPIDPAMWLVLRGSNDFTYNMFFELCFSQMW